MTTLNFRQATPADAQALEQLEQAVVEAERPFNQAIKPENARYYDMPRLISHPDTYLLVADTGDAIVATGYVQIRQSKQSLSHIQHGYLGFMYVAPEYRGKGMNKIILEKLMAWAKSHHVEDFYLDVYAANESAIRAYQKAGFQASLLEMKLHADNT